MYTDPYKFRPIVTTCSTDLSVLSCWHDYKLQQLKPSIETYIEDSNELWGKLDSFGPLPANAKLLKADANSMYTNIDTEHGLQILEGFLVELEKQGMLPLDFNIIMIVKAARLVMTWNLFKYGNLYFRQLLGTAMGTPAV